MSQGAEFDVDVVECIVSGIERLSEEVYFLGQKSRRRGSMGSYIGITG